ncbi:MAG: hypothetical protein ABW200_10855 [Hyphomicrobiaceae bacterium]
MPRSAATRNAWIMLCTAILVGGLAVVIKLVFDEMRDPDSLCVRGKEHGQTIVMIDKTDMWNTNQSDRLEAHVLGILNNDMKQEERLHVFSFGAVVEAGFKAHYSACKPPDGSKCRGFFCNPKQLEDQYKERFLAPLLAELKTLKIATQGACSPIAEAMYDVMSRSEMKIQPGLTRVVLISDLAQNTPVYTAFRAPQSCPGVTGKIDPDKDNGLLAFFDKRRPEMRTVEGSAVVFQVTPGGRSQEVADRAKRKWDEVFQLLKFAVRWEKL